MAKLQSTYTSGLPGSIGATLAQIRELQSTYTSGLPEWRKRLDSAKNKRCNLHTQVGCQLKTCNYNIVCQSCNLHTQVGCQNCKKLSLPKPTVLQSTYTSGLPVVAELQARCGVKLQSTYTSGLPAQELFSLLKTTGVAIYIHKWVASLVIGIINALPKVAIYIHKWVAS